MSVALVITAPWMMGGWLFTLDWVTGPRMSLGRGTWGLDGGVVTGLPFGMLVMTLTTLARSVGSWVPAFLVIAGSFLGAAHLVGGSNVRRTAAGLFYAINPVVYERLLAGQLAYLAGYALLPIVVRRLSDRTDHFPFGGLVAAAAAVAMAPHMVWILAPVVLFYLVVPPVRRGVTCLVFFAIGLAATSAYLFAPVVVGGTATTLSSDNLDAFQTTSHPMLGVLGNVATLYGFWRAVPGEARTLLPGWPLIFAAILLVIAVGLNRGKGWQSPPRSMIALGIAGLLLAPGDQLPLAGPLYRWLFLHLPGFAIMREPQKFIVLLALAYAFFFAHGLEALRERLVAKNFSWRIIETGIALALPIVYTPTVLWGLGGRVGTAEYPRSWAAAERIMTPRAGNVLVLPWHQYLSFDFTGTVIASPAEAYFSAPVIVSDNPEVGAITSAHRRPTSGYLEHLFGRGPELCAFGNLVAPLGVEYVLLSKTVDWKGYEWLRKQVDLDIVLDTGDMTLYRNRRYRGWGWRGGGLTKMADWGEAEMASRTSELNSAVVQVSRGAGTPPPPGACLAPPDPHYTQTDVVLTSPVSAHVSAGQSGWLQLAEPFDTGWRVRRKAEPPVEVLGGTTGLVVPGPSTAVEFAPWKNVALLYGFSVASLSVAMLGAVRQCARRKRVRVDDGTVNPPHSSRVASLD